MDSRKLAMLAIDALLYRPDEDLERLYARVIGIIDAAVAEAVAAKDAEKQELIADLAESTRLLVRERGATGTQQAEIERLKLENNNLRTGLDAEGLTLSERCCGELKLSLSADITRLTAELSTAREEARADALKSCLGIAELHVKHGEFYHEGRYDCSSYIAAEIRAARKAGGQ